MALRSKPMSTQADETGENVITYGRTYVRLVEAADVLLDKSTGNQ